ncbi:MAG: cation:proton antiporter, partial [Turneriella sp.]|nr:cation:proton antiporter [Turneriella sp.]
MDSTFSLPLKNPVLIFSLLLFIILLAPVVLNRLRIPYIVGLIFAGMLVGPHGTNLIARDASIVLFGTVGILYIMFLAGLEIDIADFIRERRLSLAFGSYTFLVPMLLGIVAGKYVLELNWLSAVLLASMFASHTLVAFPLVMRYGVVRDKAVTLTIGGTIFTDTLALLVLAVVVNLARGNAGTAFWLRMALALVLFTGVVLVGVPPLARWVYRRLDDPVTQYIFTMAIVLLCSFFAEVAGVEGIIGAFLSGLALNRLIPHTSPLMHRIEFVGNALFIPIFLIGVGMLVDLRVLLFSRSSQLTAVVMTVVATVAKYLAAFLAQKTFGLSRAQR